MSISVSWMCRMSVYCLSFPKSSCVTSSMLMLTSVLLCSEHSTELCRWIFLPDDSVLPSLLLDPAASGGQWHRSGISRGALSRLHTQDLVSCQACSLAWRTLHMALPGLPAPDSLCACCPPQPAHTPKVLTPGPPEMYTAYPGLHTALR